MSETPTVTPTAHWSLASILAAVDSSAGLVLHKAHAFEQDISTWTSGHPQVGPLIATAAKYAVGLLGGSWPLLVTAEQAVEAALGAMASRDPTIQSGSGVAPATITTTAPAVAPVPAAAPAAA